MNSRTEKQAAKESSSVRAAMLTNYIDTKNDLGGALYDDCGNCIRVWWRDHHDRRYWNATLDLRRLILDEFGTLVPVGE